MNKFLVVGYQSGDTTLSVYDVTPYEHMLGEYHLKLRVNQSTLIDKCRLCHYDCWNDIEIIKNGICGL